MISKTAGALESVVTDGGKYGRWEVWCGCVVESMIILTIDSIDILLYYHREYFNGVQVQITINGHDDICTIQKILEITASERALRISGTILAPYNTNCCPGCPPPKSW
jgi:hypothetical protein